MKKIDVEDTNEVIEKISKEKKKIKLPKEVSQEILKNIFLNILKAIGLMIYFIILNLAYNKIDHSRLATDINVFAGVFLIYGIVMLERAYKKDNGKYAITAIELLVVSFHTLSVIHMTTLWIYDFRIYLLVSSYAFSIYYVLKSIIIYTKGRKEYLNTLSDISEIVKKDEPIKKEAKKREQKEESKKTKKENKEKAKSTDSTKKTRKKKTDNKSNTKTVKDKTKAKAKIKTEKENEEVNSNTLEDKPKRKRGRPKKEVMKND